jgi:hypothetical protein
MQIQGLGSNLPPIQTTISNDHYSNINNNNNNSIPILENNTTNHNINTRSHNQKYNYDNSANSPLSPSSPISINNSNNNNNGGTNENNINSMSMEDYFIGSNSSLDNNHSHNNSNSNNSPRNNNNSSSNNKNNYKHQHNNNKTELTPTSFLHDSFQNPNNPNNYRSSSSNNTNNNQQQQYQQKQQQPHQQQQQTSSLSSNSFDILTSPSLSSSTVPIHLTSGITNVSLKPNDRELLQILEDIEKNFGNINESITNIIIRIKNFQSSSNQKIMLSHFSSDEQEKILAVAKPTYIELYKALNDTYKQRTEMLLSLSAFTNSSIEAKRFYEQLESKQELFLSLIQKLKSNCFIT